MRLHRYIITTYYTTHGTIIQNVVFVWVWKEKSIHVFKRLNIIQTSTKRFVLLSVKCVEELRV